MSPKKTEQNAVKRSPIVVVMGHIDHGKSTLLDYIRKSNIVAGEAGGITQHLGAYEVMHGPNAITFLDTPGHEAFSGIRERGANVADIAVLVVSAEEGVKKQTLEALKSIKAEKIPYIVAINKIDKAGANAETTKQSLAEHEVYVEGYGGDVPVIPISATVGTGIDDLLDMIVLMADLEDLKGNPAKLAVGSVIEAGLDNKKGIFATLLIKDGTMKSGTYILAEDAYAPVRIMEDYLGKSITSATFSSPVKVIGFNKIPNVGSTFENVMDKKEAEGRADTAKMEMKQNMPVEKNEIADKDSKVVVIPIIIKADATGSLEGIKKELKKIKRDNVVLKIVSEGIGNINEGDVKNAQSNPDIIILAFNTKPDSKAKNILERSTVNLQSFEVIYNLIEYVEKTVIAKIPKEYIDEVSGIAKILATFSRSKDKQILGGKVQEGSLLVGSEVKILRRDVEIGRGRIKELQQKKVKASEIREGYEFGALIESKIEIAEGDKIQGFKVVEKTA